MERVETAIVSSGYRNLINEKRFFFFYWVHRFLATLFATLKYITILNTQ